MVPVVGWLAHLSVWLQCWHTLLTEINEPTTVFNNKHFSRQCLHVSRSLSICDSYTMNFLSLAGLRLSGNSSLASSSLSGTQPRSLLLLSSPWSTDRKLVFRFSSAMEDCSVCVLTDTVLTNSLVNASSITSFSVSSVWVVTWRTF